MNTLREGLQRKALLRCVTEQRTAEATAGSPRTDLLHRSTARQACSVKPDLSNTLHSDAGYYSGHAQKKINTMCTLSYIPHNDGFYVTHNRDEKISRGAQYAPQKTVTQRGTVLWPGDAYSGGTWIAAHSDGRVAALLNGGLEAHHSQPPYRHSRGIIIAELLTQESTAAFMNSYALHDIEPFTLIVINACGTDTLIWDGVRRHRGHHPPDMALLFSSVTLYNMSERTLRRIWFRNWLQLHPDPTAAEVMKFHTTAGKNAPHTALCMMRDNDLKTISITQINSTPHQMTMHYTDRITGDKTYLNTKRTADTPPC